MSAANQMYSRGAEWGQEQRLYSDQCDVQTSIIFFPSSGGVAGDTFVCSFEFRKIGTLIEITGFTTASPTAPTVTPTWNFFKTIQQIDSKYRPATIKNMPMVVSGGSPPFLNNAVFSILPTGELRITNALGAANFPTGVSLYGVSGAYSTTATSDL